jgi:two-component system cell cycle response regulator
MKTVLTVDDSKVVRSMVSRYIKPWGCQLIEAADGKEGVEAAREHKPDLILLDITMPVMDGREALAELRKDAACKSIPVIMLTAESGKDIVIEVAKLGVAGYIVKPFQKETFEKGISKVLGDPSEASAEAGEASRAAARDAPLDYGSVLVVDDSERVLDAARAALEQGMKVLTATSGKEAIDRYREGRPAVVVVDLAMPDMDGFETLEQLKSLGKSAYIALAVRGDATLQDKARRAGYQGVIEKPFQPDDLAGSVMAAAGAKVPPDELVSRMLSEEDGCTVLALPGSQTQVLGRIIPAVARKLRGLAEDGGDKLIVDIGDAAEATTELVSARTAIIKEAVNLGIRTAICTPNQALIKRLREFDDTRHSPYGQDREAARASLQ